jgi:hypothetical protein
MIVRKFYYLPIYLGILSLVLSVPLVVLKIMTKTPAHQVVTRAVEDKVSASIFPQKATYKIPAEIPMGIVFESGSQKLKRADVVLNFDPTMVEVLSVSRGILMDEYPILKFDNKIGQVTIFAENKEGKAVNGIIASLKFRPLKTGVVVFDFASQSTAKITNGAQFIITE